MTWLVFRDCGLGDACEPVVGLAHSSHVPRQGLVEECVRLELAVGGVRFRFLVVNVSEGVGVERGAKMY